MIRTTERNSFHTSAAIEAILPHEMYLGLHACICMHRPYSVGGHVKIKAFVITSKDSVQPSNTIGLAVEHSFPEARAQYSPAL